MKVRGVLTKQGTDIAELLNDYAGEYADAYAGVLIAESNLNEQALREGVWPDYSAGLSQVIAANLGFGTFQQPADDETLEMYRAYMYQPENAIKEGWRYYAAALTRMGNDPLWAALSYNRGPRWTRAQLEQQVANDPAIARRLERYKQSLKEAERYRMAATVGPGIKAKMDEVGDEAITNEHTETIGGAKIVKAWGKLGLYVASDDSGQWVTVGPFGTAE